MLVSCCPLNCSFLTEVVSSGWAMEEQHPSFMRNIKARVGHHPRSISQPPTDRSIAWGAVPVEYRPLRQLETNVVNPELRPVRADLPASYHPKPSRRELKRASTPTAPLLQLPRPRAMWRRSLEDLSPTRKSEWWTDPDLEAQRKIFSIACALPPQFLEQPPAYSDEDEDEQIWVDRQDRSTFHNLHTGRIPFFNDRRYLTPTSRLGLPNDEVSPRRRSSPIQSSYTYHPRGRDDMTIDSLLSHPMLCVGPPDQGRGSRG